MISDKLYKVELIQRMFVCARSEKEAIEEAKFYQQREDYEEEYASEAKLDDIPKDWRDSWPYGRYTTKTCSEWFSDSSES